MSDAQTTSEPEEAEPLPPMPQVVLDRTPQGYFVGLLHMPGKALRPFMAEYEELHSRLVSIAVAEFGVAQEHAHGLAAATVASGNVLDEAHQENALLRAELGKVHGELTKAYGVIKDMSRPPEPAPMPAPPPAPPAKAANPPPVDAVAKAPVPAAEPSKLDVTAELSAKAE